MQSNETHLPSGLNLIAWILRPKWNRWMIALMRVLHSRHSPSSSTSSSSRPSGEMAVVTMLNCASNGYVSAVLLCCEWVDWQNERETTPNDDDGKECFKSYFFKLKTVTRLPTGLMIESPVLLKIKFPLLYTVPSKLENYKKRTQAKSFNVFSSLDWTNFLTKKTLPESWTSSWFVAIAFDVWSTILNYFKWRKKSKCIFLLLLFLTL